jgi:hypothetical protein
LKNSKFCAFKPAKVGFGRISIFSHPIQSHFMDLAAADADARASAAQAESDAHLLVGLRQLVQRHRNYRRALYTCWATIGVAVGCAIVASHDPALHWRGFNLSTAARTVSVVGIWAAFFQWTATSPSGPPAAPWSA